MQPAIAVKCLRDHIDSANTLGNLNQFGQQSYNFFESSLSSIILDDTNTDGKDFEITDFYIAAKKETNFVSSVGHYDMAAYRQDGSKVKNPVFPYSLRFEPYDQITNSYNGSTDVFEQIADVEEVTLLYDVYAMDKPEAQGGKEQHIASIVTITKFTTS